ncbi:tetratricopeptide repeat protein [Nitrosococcus oceani]|uniref:tetratricopeptide repeat protein n=1 Tax=Nitrosococcus oceani TaxID=1229 RepID=UPI0018CFEAA3|nr:tetratricopeptide repeat protein [Nitrosococcus oceani]
MSPHTYEVLTAARELMDENQFTPAQHELEALLPKIESNDYETALAYQSLAYIFLALEDYPKARRALEQSLQNEALLPLDVAQNLRYNLGQIYMRTESYRQGVKVLQQWLQKTENPPAGAWHLVGWGYYKLNRPKEALTYLQKAVAQSPREDWWVLILSIYLEQKSYAKAVPVLRELIQHFPQKRQYWLHLTDVYLMQHNYHQALNTLQLTYTQMGLEEKDLLRLAQLYLQREVPYSAARLLENELQAGTITRNAHNLELLGNSWLLAREPKKALNSLAKAAVLKRDGTLFFRCGHIAVTTEQWREAAQWFKQALSHSNFKNRGQAQLLLGIAYYQTGQHNQALKTLGKAGQYAKIRAQAQSWMQRIKSKLQISQQVSSQRSTSPG